LPWQLEPGREGGRGEPGFHLFNIMPVVGMLAGYFLFQEEIGAAQLGGALAIFCGVFLTTNADRVAYWVSGSTNSYARHRHAKIF
jgi:hypothetical protein